MNQVVQMRDKNEREGRDKQFRLLDADDLIFIGTAGTSRKQKQSAKKSCFSELMYKIHVSHLNTERERNKK